MIFKSCAFCVMLYDLSGQMTETEESYNATIALMNQLERQMDAFGRYWSQHNTVLTQITSLGHI